MTKYIVDTFTSKTFEEEVEGIITNANDSAFEKYMPKDPEPEETTKLTKTQITNLVIECADVKKNGGVQAIAHKYKVPKSIVKSIEAAIIAEWNRRQAEAAEEV